MLNRPGERMMKVVSELTGEELVTREDMYVYLRHFESLISQTTCRCINATEGGAGIKGTSVMTLSDAIDEYCRQPVDAAGVLAAAAAAYVPPSAAAVRGGIDDLLRQIRPVIDAAEEVINLLTRILALFENGPADREQVRALLASTREPARIVREAEALLRIIHTELVRELLQMRREGRVEAETFAARDDAALAADFRDDLNFQRAVARGLRNLAGWLANVRERLEDGNSASSR